MSLIMTVCDSSHEFTTRQDPNIHVFGPPQVDTHQGNLAPIDVKLSSELLVAADDGLHLLTAPQLIVGAFHFPQAGGERNVGTDHHVHPAERETRQQRRAGLVSGLPGAFISQDVGVNL